MNTNLTNKRALVCGGSKGIGFATAKELAKLGAEIILLSRSEENLKDAIQDINKINGLQNRYIIADVSDTAHMKQQVSQVLASAGSVHILINNGGGPPGGMIVDAKADEFIAAFQAHLIAAHSLAQLLMPGMREAGYGRIINIVSTSVRQPIIGLGVSNTIRGSIASWSKTMSTELAPHGITVNNILPGTTMTGRLTDIMNGIVDRTDLSEEEVKNQFLSQIPMGRFAEVEEVAVVAAFLASPAASYVTGVSLPVDGGKIRSI